MNVLLLIALVIVGTLLLCLIVAVVRHEKDAWIGRRLVEAAGSDGLANLAIAEARRERLLREKALNAATDAVFRRGIRAGVALRLVKP